MGSNTFGKIFQVTTFGESHGAAIGVVIDGCPAGLHLDPAEIQSQLNRRKPGNVIFGTERKEEDMIKILSGVFENKTLGTPLAMMIENKDHRSTDYDSLKNIYRPSHADFVYEKKYGIRDHRGGGRSSARITAATVAAGAIAELVLRKENIHVLAYVNRIHDIESAVDFTKEENYQPAFAEAIEKSMVRCPDEKGSKEMIARMETLKKEGDSCGGVIQCEIFNTPVGIGEPVFDKLQADLAKAMFSINAVHGFEYGSGFSGSKMKGSEHNDAFFMEHGKVKTKTNHSGGIQGGISNGMKIYFRVAFKPVASIKMKQGTLNKSGEKIELDIEGRHDSCVLPRAVPIVEAMAKIVLADHVLKNKSVK